MCVTDKQAEHRRVQGVLQGRSGENGLAIDGRTEKALPDTLGHGGRYECWNGTVADGFTG